MRMGFQRGGQTRKSHSLVWEGGKTGVDTFAKPGGEGESSTRAMMLEEGRGASRARRKAKKISSVPEGLSPCPIGPKKERGSDTSANGREESQH